MTNQHLPRNYVVHAYLNREDNTVIVTGRHQNSVILKKDNTSPSALHEAVKRVVEKGGVTVPWFVNASRAPANSLEVLHAESGYNKLEKVGRKLQLIADLKNRGYDVVNKHV